MTDKITIQIPTGLMFADLDLQRDRVTGNIKFSWAAIARLCAASGIEPEIFRNSNEDDIGSLIVAWYFESRQAGEPPDTIAEELIAETLLEDQHGGGFSHPPARA